MHFVEQLVSESKTSRIAANKLYFKASNNSGLKQEGYFRETSEEYPIEDMFFIQQLQRKSRWITN